eukprot:3932358-Ditylum_brightwellii.AAC.1
MMLFESKPKSKSAKLFKGNISMTTSKNPSGPRHTVLETSSAPSSSADSNKDMNETDKATFSSNYTLGCCLGKGAFSTVFLGTDRTGAEVAVKIVDKTQLIKEEHNRLERE